MTPGQINDALDLFERFVKSQEQISELLTQIRNREERFIEQRDEELSIRRAELAHREKEYERLDRWREEDIERANKHRLEELERVMDSIVPKEQK